MTLEKVALNPTPFNLINFVDKSIVNFTTTELEKMIQHLYDKWESYGAVYGELIENITPKFDTSLNRVSHVIENPRIGDGIIYVDIKILKTVCGQKIKYILDRVVFRPRYFYGTLFTVDAYFLHQDPYLRVLRKGKLKRIRNS